MALIGAAIGAGVKVLGSIAGGIAAAKAAKNAKGMISEQKAENKRWYEEESAKDYTQRADAQASLNNMREMLLQHHKNAMASQAVSGGSDEAAALAKQQANDALAQTTSNLAQQAQSYKENIQNQYRAQDAALQNQLINTELERGKQIAAAAQGVGEAGDSISKAFGG